MMEAIPHRPGHEKKITEWTLPISAAISQAEQKEVKLVVRLSHNDWSIWKLF